MTYRHLNRECNMSMHKLVTNNKIKKNYQLKKKTFQLKINTKIRFNRSKYIFIKCLSLFKDIQLLLNVE